MLETSVIEGTNVVTVTVDGAIGADEEKAAQRTVEEVAAEHGTARMLLDYGGVDVGRVEPKAVWEDLKGTRLLRSMDRVGIVADSGILDRFARAVDAVSQLEVRTFDSDHREEAVAWLTS